MPFLHLHRKMLVVPDRHFEELWNMLQFFITTHLGVGKLDSNNFMLLLLTAVTPFQKEIRFQMGAELQTGAFHISHKIYYPLMVLESTLNLI